MLNYSINLTNLIYVKNKLKKLKTGLVYTSIVFVYSMQKEVLSKLLMLLEYLKVKLYLKDRERRLIVCN